MARPRACARIAASLLGAILLAATASGCGTLPFDGLHPALNYDYGSGEALRIAVIDETGGQDWSPAVVAAVEAYAAGAPELTFQDGTDGANIVVTVRRYDDAHPPELPGYVFPPGAGGFAAVYDASGAACNYPPSPLPLNCTGEIATANIYLNDLIPPGAELEARRERLVLHELGHALGLTRHSPDLETGSLAERYGWDQR